MSSNLARAASREEFESARDICVSRLRRSSSDQNAIEGLCVACVLGEHFSFLIKDDIVELLVSSTEKNHRLRARVEIFLTYARYRIRRPIGELEESCHCIREYQEKGWIERGSEDDIRATLLRAQIAFRKGDYDTIVEDIEYVLGFEGMTDDLATNLFAAFTLSSNPARISDPRYQKTIANVENFEILHNVACAFVEADQVSEASVFLEKAIEMCRNTCEEEKEEGEDVDARFAAESAVMRAELAYCEQRMGRLEKAAAEYERIILEALGEDHVLGLAVSNLASIRRQRNVVETAKYARRYMTSAVGSKLPPVYRARFELNRGLLLCLTGKFDETLAIAEELKQGCFGEDSLCIGFSLFLEGCVDIRRKDSISALEKLKSAFEACRHPTIGYCYAQLLYSSNRVDDSLAVLEELLNEESSFEHVAIVARIYCVGMGQVLRAAAVLKSAALKWKQKNPNAMRALLRFEGKILLEGKEYREAAHVFEELVTVDREDRGAVADLVRAYAHFDLDQARRFASLLPDIAVERIEDGEIEQSISRLRGARDSQDSSYLLSDTVSSAAPARVKRRKRKNRLPKNLVPGKLADPERWIPLRDRSYYKPKTKGKHRSRDTGSSQGTAQYDDKATERISISSSSASSGRRRGQGHGKRR